MLAGDAILLLYFNKYDFNEVDIDFNKKCVIRKILPALKSKYNHFESLFRIRY